jgi:hypothetical protein
MYKYLSGRKALMAHNAAADVECLGYIFERTLDRGLLNGKDWRKDKDIMGNGYKSLRTIWLSSIRGVGPSRLGKICKAVQPVIRDFEDTKEVVCNVNMLMPIHLVAYGSIVGGIDWHDCVRAVERMLRMEANIHFDTVLVEILRHVCGVSAVDLVHHTMTSDGDTEFFPTMPGDPISFLPFVFCLEEAKSVMKVTGARTASEILVNFTYTPARDQIHWLKMFNECLDTPMSSEKFSNTIDVLRRFG